MKNLTECAILRNQISALQDDRDELLAALRASVDMLQECLRNADNDTADTIDAVLIEAQAALAKAEGTT